MSRPAKQLITLVLFSVLLLPAQKVITVSSIPQNTEDIPQIVPAYDIMSKTIQLLEYAVPELLPMGLIILAGKQKIGKSWLDLNLGIAIATGGIALSKWKCEQGDVLYLALEDNDRRMQTRL